MLRHPMHVRLATELVTGNRYVVLAVRAGIVHCYGDVYHAKALAARHQAALKFQREDVSIEEVRYTKKLLKQLLRQHLGRLRSEGYDVTMGLSKKGEVTYVATKAMPSGGISTLTIK